MGTTIRATSSRRRFRGQSFAKSARDLRATRSPLVDAAGGHPEIHAEYLEAGAESSETNTFMNAPSRPTTVWSAWCTS